MGLAPMLPYKQAESPARFLNLSGCHLLKEITVSVPLSRRALNYFDVFGVEDSVLEAFQ